MIFDINCSNPLQEKKSAKQREKGKKEKGGNKLRKVGLHFYTPVLYNLFYMVISSSGSDIRIQFL